MCARTRTLTGRVAGLAAKINLFALSLLRDGSFSSLFWTLVLTGSISMAIPVIFLSYTSDFFKDLIYR